MIQIKAFTDTLYSTAERKANRFLSTLKPEQYIDTRLAIRSEPDSRETKHCILIVYKSLDEPHQKLS
ncbi:hypothetical protein ACFQWB_11890 [Paenibacillus thermoaerophilus]|uniref:Sporulation protein Cse60 n=1 Tax=Paenibacillus thermoaerophilus TaxID=1215385 RepID=A0ABW2V758_9BACL|nr:hypothetical protein [Paenibacillus thermoaerophilus]TMV17696.1 hypothetical protein FE781_06070 [Paenibacillus thermoaerophilus]